VALAKYFAALELEFNNPNALYNIGLIYKYRGAWRDSFKYNKRAVEIRGDESELWNLGIAATALRDWQTARDVWKRCGMELDAGEGLIMDNLGMTPIRLDPNDRAEVVWGRRLCPVRARVLNLPFPESGVGYGDIVLHDGAPVGTRFDSDGREKSVFNMLEMFEPSDYSTYVVDALADSQEMVQLLADLCDARRMAFEDWHSHVNIICKACSEGRAHEAHEKHDHKKHDVTWKRERTIGIGARSEGDIEAVLEAWDGEVTDWGVTLER
jgi:hypothetical protein